VATVVLELIRRYDTLRSEELHDDRRWPHGTKPYAVSPNGWRQGHSPDESSTAVAAEFRMTILDGSLLGPGDLSSHTPGP
jgi:hypothetical protein